MPIHDWRRVIAGTFHHFHQMWITEISNALNGGLLPTGYYAMAEQVAGGPHPEACENHGGSNDVITSIADHPPRLRYTLEAEEAIYAAKADRIAVYHASGDRAVAFLEIISPGNKHSEVAVIQVIERLSRALARGCHLTMIDLFPPGRHDPQGIHAEIWGKPDPLVAPEEPLLLAAYRAAVSPVASLEPMAVGCSLVDMPLFLANERYINLPLEKTYLAAWNGMPERWKQVIEPATTA